MNILVLSWRGPGHPHVGGAEQSTFEHAKGWVKAGHQVTLFTSSFAEGKDEEILNGVRIIRKGDQILVVRVAAIWWYLFGKHPRYDLIIDEFHGVPFFTPLYAGTKKLAFIHEVTKEVWRLNPWPWPFNLIPATLGTAVEPLIFKLLYKNIPFMTVSQSTKKDLISWGIPKNNITVIYNGITVPKLRSIPSKERLKTLIFLGAISKDKGIEDAIRVFYLINKTQGDWQFWVVGKANTKYLEKLKKLTKKLSLHKKVKFFGFVSDRQKYELLAKAHILINPSIREGWGLVVIEAARVGTPTVGYKVPGLMDSIKNGKTGILCNPKPEDCAAAVMSLINNMNKYKSLSINCLRWSKKFSWDKSSKQSLKLITKIANVV